MISCVVENGNITFLLENPQKLAQNFTNQVIFNSVLFSRYPY